MQQHRSGAVTARQAFLALLGTLAALDLLIFAIRLADVWSLGRLSLLPAEGPVLYAIWKIRNGYPLYEFPFQPPFTLTLYNFLFYRTYAAVFDAGRVANDATPIAARLVTAAFAAAGALAQYAGVRRLVRLPASFRPAVAMIAIATWFGSALPGWWTLAIRPDVPAVALSTCGIAAALTAFRRGGRGWLLTAGAAFAAAWMFKQSQVALFAALCAYVLVWRRSVAELLFVAAPFAIGAAAALAIGGGVYRANIVDAPRLNSLVPYLALYWYRSVALSDLLLWGMAVAAIVAIGRPGSADGPLSSVADVPRRSVRLFGTDVTLPALATLSAGASGALLLTKPGSALNHILELNVAASLVCSAVLAAAWDSPARRGLLAAAALMLVPMVAFQTALLWNDDSAVASALQLKSWRTHLHLAPPGAARDRERLAAVFGTLPHPVFTDDELFAQPWHATDNRYPTVVLDHVFYDAARAKGRVGRGVEGLFTDRYFAAALLPDSSAFLGPAMRAGYHLAGTIPQNAGEPLRILLRDR